MTPASLTLPCSRCGRPVVARAGVAGAHLRCDRCSTSPETWVVYRGASSERLDRATVIARLRSGALAPTDSVGDGSSPSQPIGAHPAFRTLFLPGHADFVEVQGGGDKPGLFQRLFKRGGSGDGATAPKPASAPPPPARIEASKVAPAAPRPASGAPPAAPRKPPRASSLRGPLVAVLGLVGIAAAGWILRDDMGALVEGLELPALPRSDRPPTPDAASAPPAAPAAAPDPGDPNLPPATLDALLARATPTDEPRNLLLARAWAARYRGSAEAHAEAVDLATQAAARLPNDPEALALFAELRAESGQVDAFTTEALQRASRVAPLIPAVSRATAAVSLANGQEAEALAAAKRCVDAHPGELGCRYQAARSMPAATPVAERLAAFDALATAWPQNRAVPRAAALAAARAGSPDAVGRLEKVRAGMRDDPEVSGALARAYLAGGKPDQAAGIVRSLGAKAPGDVVLELASAALQTGDAARARTLLAPLAEAEPTAPADRRRYRVLVAQAAYLTAVASPGDAAAATAANEAAKAAIEVGRTAPACVQVRLLAAIPANDLTAAQRAWETVDRDSVSGRDLARLWLARVRFELASGLPRDAVPSVEQALKADFRLPEVHLWSAAIGAASQDAPMAFRSLARAIRDVDGVDARRDQRAELLAVPADTAKLSSDLRTLVASNATLEDQLTLALATVAWLEGDLDTAAATIRPLASRDPRADTQALFARVLYARGDLSGALSAIERATTTDPREVAWHLQRAQILYALGRIEDTRIALATVKSAGALGSVAMTLDALVQEKLGDHARAVESARQAVRFDPSDLEAAKILAQLGG